MRRPDGGGRSPSTRPPSGGRRSAASTDPRTAPCNGSRDEPRGRAARRSLHTRETTSRRRPAARCRHWRTRPPSARRRRSGTEAPCCEGSAQEPQVEQDGDCGKEEQDREPGEDAPAAMTPPDRLLLSLDLGDRDDGGVHCGDSIGFREGVLIFGQRLLARVAVAGKHPGGDLERDDRDVVLAAAPVRRLDQRAQRAVDVVAVALDDIEDRLLRDHVCQAVGAKQEEVSALGLDAERIDVDVRVGAERARDDGALRMRLGLLARELAGLEQLVDERVILRQLLHLRVADEVGARVADVTERDVVVLDERDRDRRAHAGCVGVAARAVVDPAVRLLDQVGDALLAAAVRAGFLQRGGREARRDLARLRASHAVRDGEERRLDDVGVLVVPPRATRIGDGCGAGDHWSYLRSVSPMRMMSPCVRRRGCSSRAPFRYVPFVEPRSCTQTPSWRGSKRAWRADANSSERIGMSFCPPRPIVSCAESSSKSWPSARSALLTTTSRPVTGPRRAGWTPAWLDGARMKLSCGRRRSRLAVRTMRQMKRYRTTRNAILRMSRTSSTAAES